MQKMSQCFPKPFGHFDEDIRVNLDLPNYVTKADLKGATEVSTPNLALKSNSAKLMAEVEKTDIGKLKTAPVDFSKLSNVLNNVVEKLCIIN